MQKRAQRAEKNRDIAVADVTRLLDLARANDLHVPPTLVQSRFVTSQTVANIGSSPPLLQSPDLPVGARLVENETSQHTSLHDTSLHDTSLHDTPLHDLPSTPAESTPSSSLPVPSSCDIVSGVGHGSRTPPSPRRHTNMELAAAGVRKACLPEVIYKNMLLAYTVCAALRRIGRETKDQKKLITALLSGPEIKRARLRSTICKKVGISERTVRRKTDMSLQDSTKKRRILPAASDELRHTIYVFLSRDDNSSLCPAKAASTRCEEGRKQNRILSDYVYALHLKFLSENTDFKVSQSLFYRLVPKHIKFSKDLKVRGCLCEKCENFQHLLRRMAKLTEKNVPLSCKRFCEEFDDGVAVEELLKDVDEEEVSFCQWRKVQEELTSYKAETVDGKVKRVKTTRVVDRTKLVTVSLNKKQFENKFRHTVADWREHYYRLRTQFEEIRKLRERMDDTQLMIQLDFAENYTCHSCEEVQSAHWNKTAVTLHPVVVHFRRTEDGPLEHKSLTYISELDKAHNAEMVHCILRKLMSTDLHKAIGADVLGKVTMINYISDSPYSQYRNKYIYFLIANHHFLYGYGAVWHYMECGHGKGSCDGVGGTVKRLADQASLHGSEIVDADSLYLWATTINSSIHFSFVTVDEFELAEEDIRKLRDLKMKTALGISSRLHSIRRAKGLQNVCWRDTSCCCDECINQLWPNCTARADNWKTVSLFPKTRTVPLKVACGCDIFCVCPDRKPDESVVKVIVTKHREKQKSGPSVDNNLNDLPPDRADVDVDVDETIEGVVAEVEQAETESVGYADDEPGVDEPEVSIFLS